MNGDRSSVIAISGLVAAAFGLLVACGEPSQTSSAPPNAIQDQSVPRFTGRTSCAPCHEKAESRHDGSHHDLAMDVASDLTVRGEFDGRSLTHDGVTTTFRRDLLATAVSAAAAA